MPTTSIHSEASSGNTLPHVWPSVVHMLAHAAVAYPDHEAVVLGEQRVSYGQLAASASAFASQLRALGAGPGQRIALLMSNSADMVVAIFAIQASGAQLVPLNPAYTGAELEPILEDAECLALVYDTAVAERLAQQVATFDMSHRFAIGPGSSCLVLRDESDVALPLPLPEPDDLALLLYTGGTTGRPKGVNLTHRAVATNTSQRDALLPTREGIERLLVITPLFHSYALATTYTSVYACGTLVLLTKYKPAAVLRLVDDERITILAASPTIFIGLLACEELASASLASLTCSYSGSAALPLETLRQWELRSGSVVVEGYGQTEAGPVLTYNPLHGPRKSGTVGPAVPDTEIQIVDPDTGLQVLGPGQIGEIRARGPQIMKGYRGLPNETATALRDGWLYTGDLGEVDTDGYFTIRDRKKDMVIVSGFNVYPREIEEALSRHPQVRESAVVGIPDGYRGEALAALVVAVGHLDEDVLREYLAQRLVKYKQPAQLHFVSTLPKTAVGKPDKVRIRRDLATTGSIPPTLSL